MDVKITRIEGHDDGWMDVTIGLRVNVTNREALERFAKILKLMIPEDERAEFLEKFKAGSVR